MMQVLPAAVHHAESLARDLREGDLAEGLALGSALEDQIRNGIRDSVEAWVALDAGEPVAAWGLVEGGALLAPAGRPWFHGTHRLPRHGRLCARASRVWVEVTAARYWRLEGWVDARYAISVRWIMWLGFQLDEPVPVEPSGVLFHRFWMERF